MWSPSCVFCFCFFKQFFKNVKPILNLQAVQKQATGQIWQIDQSLWTPALYHCQINPPEMHLWSYHFLVYFLVICVSTNAIFQVTPSLPQNWFFLLRTLCKRSHHIPLSTCVCCPLPDTCNFLFSL